MIVEITARATGPYGELNRRQRLSTPQIPEPYLHHLVQIGVAVVISSEITSTIPEGVKKPLGKKPIPSSASQPDPVSQEKTVKPRRGRKPKSSS